MAIKISELPSSLITPAGDLVSIPQEFLAVLPDACRCGAELYINEALTQLSCQNPQCITKVTQRLVDMLAYLGVLGMGEAKCYEFIKASGYSTPYIIFAFDPVTDYARFSNSFSQEFLQKIHSQLADHRSFTLAEYVKLGFLPGIQDSAFKIFKNYSDINVFYADFDAQGVDLLAKLFNLKPESETVLSTYRTLQTYRNDLIQAVTFVNIKGDDVKTFNICISTAVGAPFKSKSDFVTQMNTKYGDKVHLNWCNSVTRTGVDYLICADPDGGTRKAVNARKYGVPILSGSEFEELLKGL